MNNKLSTFYALLTMVLAPLSADSLTLSKAYELALGNNHAYKSKQYESASTVSVQEQRESRLYPQIQLSLSGGLHDYIQNYNTEMKVSEFYKSYTLSMSQPLYHPELLTSIKQSQLQTTGAETELSKSAQLLGLEVAKAYIDIAGTQRLIEITRENHRFYSLKYTQILNMLSLGLSNKMDLLDTQIYRDRAQIEINTLERKLHLSQKKLNQLLLVSVEEVPRLTENTEEIIEKIKSRNNISRQSNTDLKIAMLAKEISEYEISLRRSDHYPKVDIALSRTENDTNDRAAYKTDNRAFVQISIPLYQGGYTSARIEEAKLLSYSAAEKEMQTRMDLDYRIEELQNDQTLYLQNVQILDTAKLSAMTNLKAVETAKQAGLKSQPDLLEAQNRLYKIEQDRIIQFSELIKTYLSLLSLETALNPDLLAQLEPMIFDLPH